jgi:hypothetical protein
VLQIKVSELNETCVACYVGLSHVVKCDGFKKMNDVQYYLHGKRGKGKVIPFRQGSKLYISVNFKYLIFVVYIR